jgi:restriction endonuclease
MRDDRAFVLHLSDALREVREFVEGTDYEGFLEDRMMQNAVIRFFEIGPVAGTSEFLSELGFGNQLVLPEERVLENLRGAQARNDIERSGELDGMNFTTEMETGTGKTYVYLLESPPISFS